MGNEISTNDKNKMPEKSIRHLPFILYAFILAIFAILVISNLLALLAFPRLITVFHGVVEYEPLPRIGSFVDGYALPGLVFDCLFGILLITFCILNKMKPFLILGITAITIILFKIIALYITFYSMINTMAQKIEFIAGN